MRITRSNLPPRQRRKRAPREEGARSPGRAEPEAARRRGRRVPQNSSPGRTGGGGGGHRSPERWPRVRIRERQSRIQPGARSLSRPAGAPPRPAAAPTIPRAAAPGPRPGSTCRRRAGSRPGTGRWREASGAARAGGGHWPRRAGPPPATAPQDVEAPGARGRPDAENLGALVPGGSAPGFLPSSPLLCPSADP